MKSKHARRLFAVVLTLVLSVGLLGISALAAGTVNEVKEKNGNDGSIVVTVYDQDPGSAGTGEETYMSGEPVEGVGINALRIGSVVELTSTNESGTVSTQVAFGLTKTYADLLGLDTNDAIASRDSTYYFEPTAVQNALSTKNSAAGGQAAIEQYLTNNKTATQVTNSNGTATFESLNYGLYLLAKSSLPADATTDLVPFLVSVPMYVEGDGWNTTVYAYPKVRTADITISKTVNDDDKYVNAGQTLKYTVTTTIPASLSVDGTGDANEFTRFKITDTNADETLAVDTNSMNVTLDGVALDKPVYESDSATLTSGDYEVTYESGIFTITLTADGLSKINNDMTNAQTLTVTYDATVATDVTFSTKLTNTAKATYQREGMENSADTEEAKVDLYTYGIDLTKTLSDTNDTIEADKISFELYKTYDSKTGTLSNPIPVKSDTGGYWVDASTGATYTMNVPANTTGNSSHLYLYGLEPGTYYLKETATMEGYTLLDEPITIVITAPETLGDEATATVNGANAQVTNGVVSLSVENTKITTGFTLPQTGGAGTLLATAIGLGLLCAAVILLVVYRKKGQKNS